MDLKHNGYLKYIFFEKKTNFRSLSTHFRSNYTYLRSKSQPWQKKFYENLHLKNI